LNGERLLADLLENEIDRFVEWCTTIEGRTSFSTVSACVLEQHIGLFALHYSIAASQ